MTKFNFEEWELLYKNSPEEFERKRKQVIEEYISKVPIQQRNIIRLIQMECDVYHETLTPLAATVAISELMLEKVSLLKNKIDLLATKLKNQQTDIE